MSQGENHAKTLQETAGDRDRVLPMMKKYLNCSGMTLGDFAHRIDYSEKTLQMFTSGKYHNVAGTHRLLCEAIEQYIHANPIEPPCAVMGQLYDTENARLIRRTIQKLLKRPVACMIYGPPGSQKSFTLEYEIARLNREELPRNGQGRRAYYVYCLPGMKPTQLMKEIAIACGSNAAGDRCRIRRNLAWDFRSRRVMLALDETQNLGATESEWVVCLETVRALLDRPPYFSLLLCGMHTLLTKFNRLSARLGQWNDRLVDKVVLPGLTEEEARAIAQREAPDMSEGGIAKAIKLAMRVDAYNNERQYINIRSLTGTLRERQLLRQQQAS